MAVTTSYALTVNTVETIDTSVPAIYSGDNTVTHNGYSKSGTLNAGTTPPATKCCYQSVALVAGAKTVDLTALTGTNGATVDGSALKVQLFQVTNKTANANTMTFTEGGANGYELAGNAWTVTLQPGQSFVFYGNDATPDVAAGAKNIDVTGTLVQEFELSVVMG